MKTIMFDVDGVLADFSYAFTKECGIFTPVAGPEQQAWDFPEIPREVQNEVWKRIKASRDWWLNLPSLVSADVFWKIDELVSDHQLVFVTSRVGIAPQLQTELWLHHYGIQNPCVVVSKRKAEIAKAIDADYSIDDKPENVACVHWIADVKPCRSYVIDRPYNRTGFIPKNVRRVLTVEEFLNDIEEGK